MFKTIADPRDILRSAVQAMRAAHDEYRRPCSHDSSIFWNLDNVAEFNVRGESLCGQASSWLEDYLPAFLETQGLKCAVFKVTSSIENGCFHHFNMVKIEGMEPVICDLTAAQYFNRPMTALKGQPYFVGTRAELSEIVNTAKGNTWHAVQAAFPAYGFRSLWDVDFHYYKDYDFRTKLRDFLEEGTQDSCLTTESFYYPMEITWGDKRSHLLSRHANPQVRAALSEKFLRSGMADLTEDTDPKIPTLITTLSSDRFSLQHTPAAQGVIKAAP